MDTATEAQTLTTYFWVLTVQVAQQRGGVTAFVTTKGTVAPISGDTRESLFVKIRDYVADQLVANGHPRAHDVLFYSLEPNQL